MPVHPKSPHPPLNIKLTHPLNPIHHPSLCLSAHIQSTSELPKNSGFFKSLSSNRVCCLLVNIRDSQLMLWLTFSAGISTVSLMASDPCRMVPVKTVPWPRMEKQWSTDISRSPPGSLLGRYVCFFKSWHRHQKVRCTYTWSETWLLLYYCRGACLSLEAHVHIYYPREKRGTNYIQ